MGQPSPGTVSRGHVNHKRLTGEREGRGEGQKRQELFISCLASRERQGVKEFTPKERLLPPPSFRGRKQK